VEGLGSDCFWVEVGLELRKVERDTPKCAPKCISKVTRDLGAPVCASKYRLGHGRTHGGTQVHFTWGPLG